MTPELIEQWAAALESGKYKQGRAELRSCDDEFCCLGVLCDIIAPEGWKPLALASARYDYAHPSAPEDHRTSIPPAVLLDQIGLTRNQAYILAGVNDRGVPFTLIAEALRDGSWQRPDAFVPPVAVAVPS
jgi:hypothetical protein